VAGKTQGEKVDELMQAVATLTERLDNLREEVKGLDLTGVTTRLAVVEKQLEDFKKGKEEWGRRLWAILGPILGAVIGVLVGYLLRR
jgi:hypothetical protein